MPTVGTIDQLCIVFDVTQNIISSLVNIWWAHSIIEDSFYVSTEHSRDYLVQKIVSIEFPQETKEVCRKWVLTKLTWLMKKMLDGTSINQAYLIAKGTLKICNVNWVHLINIGKSFAS